MIAKYLQNMQMVGINNFLDKDRKSTSARVGVLQINSVMFLFMLGFEG